MAARKRGGGVNLALALIGGIGIWELVIIVGPIALVVLGVRYMVRRFREGGAPREKG